MIRKRTSLLLLSIVIVVSLVGCKAASEMPALTEDPSNSISSPIAGTLIPSSTPLPEVINSPTPDPFREVTEEMLALRDQDRYSSDYYVSQDLSRIALKEEIGNKVSVIIDGITEKKYDEIKGFHFSPDSQHYAYFVVEGDQEYVIIDGVEQTHYKRLEYIPAYSEIFSPDSQHFGYVAIRDQYPIVVIDGVELGEYEYIYKDLDSQRLLFFSDNGKHHAFIAANISGNFFMVIDGKEGSFYDDIRGFSFSPSNDRYAYTAKKGNKWVVIIDGVESKEYDDFFYDLVFSPDGEHIAYDAEADGKRFIVLDGIEITQYDRAISPTFSETGGRFGFRAMRNGKWFLVIDGVEGTPHQEFIPPPRFSPDGSRVGYVVDNGAEYIVVDGEKGKDYFRVFGPIFSEYGLHVAYKVIESKDGDYFYVINGIEEPGFSLVSGFKFSPDESHYAYVVEVNEDYSVVIDGEMGPVYDDIHYYGLVFLSPNRIRYIAFQGDKILKVEETID